MCSIVGFSNHPEAAALTAWGLYATQHRGEESAGCAALSEGIIREVRGMGKVERVLTAEMLPRLPGTSAIGQVRYSTSGSSTLNNAQPLVIRCKFGYIAVAHNGNITNASELRDMLEAKGSIFSTDSDTEVFLHLITQSRKTEVLEAITEALQQLQGAFSLLILTTEGTIAARDCNGFRPLSMGKLTLPSGEACHVFASETCVFNHIGAEYVRDIEPGEIVATLSDGLHSSSFGTRTPSYCAFEHVYFSRTDSVVFGRMVAYTRIQQGKLLAAEHHVDADVVVGVPDSGTVAATGYSQMSKIPLVPGLQRSHYTGRSFIAPQQATRETIVRQKLSAVPFFLDGKRVILVDDSLVRGTTSRILVKMVREAGAKEVHFRIACPPTIASCFYGVDTPSTSQLIGAHETAEAIRQFMGADSLGYLSLENLHVALGPDSKNYCYACYTGEYPAGTADGLIQIRS